MTHQHEVSYPGNIETDFLEGKYDKEIKTIFPYQEAIEQESIQPTEKCYRDSPELRQLITTGKKVHKFLPKKLI